MKKNFYLRILSSIVLIPTTTFLIIAGNIYFNLFLLLTCCFSLKEWFDINYKKNFFIIGFLFIIFSFLNAFWLRNNDNGLLLFFFVIIICVSSDLGGYIFGSILKGPKLISISPNKTYSGVIGAYFFSIFSIYIFYKNYNIFDKNYLFDLNLFLIVFFISSISQIGDLIISYFKRRSNIKDTGKLIPGHGGILDRIDGLIFSIPFFNILIILIDS